MDLEIHREIKKIVVLTLSLTKGGAESQLVNLCIFLKNKGYDIDIIRVLPQNDFNNELAHTGISNYYFNYKSISGLFNLFRYINRQDPVLLISFMFGANIIGRILKIIFGVPLITSVRASSISMMYTILYGLTNRIDNLTVFNSQEALDKFLQKNLTNRKNSLVINNAVKFPKDKILQIYSKENRFVSIAHFRKEKDYETLFVAISILKSENINVIVDVVGKTFNLKWPKERVKELHIEELINFHGYVHSPEKFIINADAVVLSSLGEGTPNALLEGMAFKKPIIASRVAGCQSLISQANCGFLFEKQNPRDLADKIKEYISLDVIERNILGQNGYEYLNRNFEESAIYEKWLFYINSVIDKKL